MVALIIVITVLIIAFASVYVFTTKTLFNYAIVRRETPSYDREYLENQGLGEYADGIISSRAEFLASPLETVSVKSFDGLTLKAWLHTAKNAKGTIILFHGYRSTPDFDFCIVKKFYEELGLNILFPHQRAHGLSEGEYITFGIKERRDVHTWIDFINKHFGYQQPVFLSGLSMGASTVLMSAGKEYPDNVKLIIADCGFTSPRNIFEHFTKTMMKMPFWLYIPLFNRICKKKAGFSADEYSTTEALKNCKIPVFIIHGEADNFVPAYMSKESYEACASEKHLLIVPKAEHALSFVLDDGEYKSTIKSLLSRYIEI